MRDLVKITLGAQDYYLRPTFEAYGKIEAVCGNLRDLYATVATGRATLQVLAYVVKVGTDANGEALGQDAIGNRLFEQGPWALETAIEPVSAYLAELGWTPEQRKKAQAEAAAAMETRSE